MHCIVWAKQLFQLMFGKTEESMLYEDPVTGKSAFMDQVCVYAIVPLSFETCFSPVLSVGEAFFLALSSAWQSGCSSVHYPLRVGLARHRWCVPWPPKIAGTGSISGVAIPNQKRRRKVIHVGIFRPTACFRNILTNHRALESATATLALH